MGDPVEGPFRLGQDGTPQVCGLIRPDFELVNEESNDGLQGNTSGGKVNALQRRALRETIVL